MAYSTRRLLPQHLQNRFINLLSPLVRLISKWGLSPNSFTVAGVILTAAGTGAFLAGFIRLAGICILLGGLCDTLDGLLARTTGRATRFGALLDSTVDRYAEFIMFSGIAAYFFFIDDYGTAAGTLLALGGSFMVSYTRARAESLGFDAKGGFMQRPERIVLIGSGAIIHLNALILAIWLVAFFANFTALQRIRCAYKQDSSEFKEEIIIKT
ncbi:MAG: CDP-alcohol phosphatidyltransferase family protein [Deltaproteobacteria bacterium]|jgi:CDP-diacylglycerol--glycerol-3-phosphate 3-phosphatidyltransferase|nr:CDP-alcohol phosphatidyltransferase family protein [Deltaproteobacteria bacterium]MBW2479372.1 CDP-alcohol phosphatidyltransferase family protein [Deltaproteobacteria bacterium]